MASEFDSIEADIDIIRHDRCTYATKIGLTCGEHKNCDGCIAEMAESLLRRQREAFDSKRAERTCKVTPSKNLQGIVKCECNESFPEYYEYCPYCGAKVTGD